MTDKRSSIQTVAFLAGALLCLTSGAGQAETNGAGSLLDQAGYQQSIHTDFPSMAVTAAEPNPHQPDIEVSAQTYKSRWDQVGGSFTTGWVPNNSQPVCYSSAQCNCNGQNLCGTFYSGQINYWWPRGCHKPPMKILCSSVPE